MRFLHSFLKFLTTAALLATAVACTANTAEPAAQPATTVPPTAAPSGAELADLLGSRWELVSYGDQTPLPDTELTLIFGEDGVGGAAGCNSYFLGNFGLTAGQLTIGEAASTKMFCDGRMEQEQAFLTMLQSATALTVEGDTLRLTTPTGDMVFQSAPAAEETAVAGPNLADLIGTDWDVVTYAGQTPLPNTQLTLRFTAKGVGGSAGCNRYGLGDFQLTAGQISMGFATSTLMLCSGLDGWMEQEEVFLTMIESATTVTFNGDQLVIGTPEGEIVFQAAVYQTLESGAWVLSSIAQADAIVSTAHDSAITAAFQNGQLTGAVGCNEYSASYEAAEGQLTLGPVAVTQRRCPERGEGERVAEFLATLPSAAGYSIERDTLTLLDADGRLLITFQSEK